MIKASRIYLFGLVLLLIGNLPLIGEAGVTFSKEELTRYHPGYPNKIYRRIRPLPFKVGEKLTFTIQYGFIKAGTSYMEIPGYADVRGNFCFKISVKNRTNSFFDNVYKVRDEIISYIDYHGLFTWRYEKHLREGSYKQDRVESYYQERHIVYSKKKWIPIEPFTMDALSALYYIRTLKLEPGKDVYFENHTDGKNYTIRVIVHKRETLKTRWGKVKTIVVEPVMKDPGVFKSEGKITVWLTDDSLKVPIKLSSKVFVGSFSANLEDYQGVTINFKN